MPTYIVRSHWDGRDAPVGHTRVGSGALEAEVASRPLPGRATSPEEMIGVALISSYLLQLVDRLHAAGHDADDITVSAAVEVREDAGCPQITRISLDTHLEHYRLTHEQKRRICIEADEACPISRALTGTDILLNIR